MNDPSLSVVAKRMCAKTRDEVRSPFHWRTALLRIALAIVPIFAALITSADAQNLSCVNCHGSEAKHVASPNCGSCHVGASSHGAQQLSYDNAFDPAGNSRSPQDDTFAVNAGKTYSTSVGHGGVKCARCHGDAHDQPHMKIVADCVQCHKADPPSPDGPHGMHPAGQSWVRRHGLQVDENGAARCIECHGADRRGTILSRAFVDRSFATKFGQKNFARGTPIGCNSCHTASGTE